MDIPKKRRSRGRTKGGKGRASFVQCGQCGQLIPRDKAKKVSRRISLVDSRLAKELHSQGAIISTRRRIRYYCVSCAVHRGIIKVRSKTKRQSANRLR